MQNHKDDFKKEEELKKLLEEGLKRIRKGDEKKVFDNQEKIEKKVKKSGALSKFFDDIKLMFSLLKDYFSGKYKKVPWKVIVSVIFALLYVLSPLDIIPDFIPGIGYIDDAAVVGFVLKSIKSEFEDYKIWKEEQ